mgnify:CR=1 FL=1
MCGVPLGYRTLVLDPTFQGSDTAVVMYCKNMLDIKTASMCASFAQLMYAVVYLGLMGNSNASTTYILALVALMHRRPTSWHWLARFHYLSTITFHG